MTQGEPGAGAPTASRVGLQEILDAMTEGVLLLDADLRVLTVNRSLARLFGLTADVRGHTVMEALRLHEVKALAEQAVTEGEALGAELSPPGLEERYLRVNATALRDAAGSLQNVVLVVHDLTHVKQLERARTEFVANVSHELRTPLSLIKGCVETLLQGAKSDPAVTTRFLQIARKHTDRLGFLIEDLLILARLESGQAALNLGAVSPHSLADLVLHDLQARADERNITLHNQLAPDWSAQADASRLQQVFFNLIENAIKYGRPGGRVVVAGRLDPSGAAEIAVRDDGPGIPWTAQKRVFERFYRVDQGRSRDEGGTGLGLAIVKHIVQLHGGRVWLESTPGQGASFFFTVPQAPASHPPGRPNGRSGQP